MTRLRPFILLFTFLLTTSWLSALDNNYFAFSITPQFEIANGVIKEYVFEDACLNIDNKESQLDWDVKTIALFGLQADFDIIRYISLGLSASFAVPQSSGFMQDYDWLNSIGGQYNHPEWENDDPTECTNFSEHINKLDKYIIFNLSLRGNIYLPAEIKVTPHLGYKYEFIRFTGADGYSNYKWNNHEIQTFSGKVISYEQELHSMLLGLNLEIGCIPRTTINLNFDISPYLTILNATDKHYVSTPATAYLDKFKKLVLIESGLTAQYTFSKNHAAGINGSLQYEPLSKGNTYSRTINSSGNFTSSSWQALSDCKGGTERFIWSLGLNYSFSL